MSDKIVITYVSNYHYQYYKSDFRIIRKNWILLFWLKEIDKDK